MASEPARAAVLSRKNLLGLEQGKRMPNSLRQASELPITHDLVEPARRPVVKAGQPCQHFRRRFSYLAGFQLAEVRSGAIKYSRHLALGEFRAFSPTAKQLPQFPCPRRSVCVRHLIQHRRQSTRTDSCLQVERRSRQPPTMDQRRLSEQLCIQVHGTL